MSLRVVISNFSAPLPSTLDYEESWRDAQLPSKQQRRLTLFEQPHSWGFHIYAIGVYLMDIGMADRVEFWDYRPERTMSYLANGVLKMTFHNANDIDAYLRRFGSPDLFINYGVNGLPVCELLEGEAFRVHVPCLRLETNEPLTDAECFLIDDEALLDERSMLYVPVVNTDVIRPASLPKVRDFVYLASYYEGKRHDLLVKAVRGTNLTGHLHPVGRFELDLSQTNISTSDLDERDPVELLQTSRIAVYSGDNTSNPAAMWECVAAGLPIVMNSAIRGGKHLVVSGVTGEFAAADEFVDVMRSVLENREDYRAREYFEATWATVPQLERYLTFFKTMGWNA